MKQHEHVQLLFTPYQITNAMEKEGREKPGRNQIPLNRRLKGLSLPAQLCKVDKGPFTFLSCILLSLGCHMVLNLALVTQADLILCSGDCQQHLGDQRPTELASSFFQVQNSTLLY